MYADYKELLVQKEDKLLTIKFNNPKRKNCINLNGYTELGRVLRQSATDDSVTVVVLTGVGDFFTAGNDLNAIASGNVTDIDAHVQHTSKVFAEMVNAFIDCPKITIALVNGPCIGIGASLAGLCDMLWCADHAYFLTPFTKLGIVPESCSSYLFPLLMGRSKATEMLLLSEKMSAAEAYHFNFASKIFRLSELDTEIWPKIKAYSELPPQSMRISKELIRMHERDGLRKALQAESDQLYKRFFSEEAMNALIAFSSRKSKL